MTPLAQHAVALARLGHWRLLDALEVVERRKDEPLLAGIAHSTGDVPMLGYATEEPEAEEDDCPDCDGDGEVECCECGHTRDCRTCDGSGRVDAMDPVDYSPGDVRAWRTLNGEPRDFDAGMRSLAGWLSARQADAFAREYGRLVEALRP